MFGVPASFVFGALSRDAPILVTTEPASAGFPIESYQLRVFDGNGTFITVRTLDANQQSYLYQCDADRCAPLSTYMFQIRASNSKGYGEWSANETM